MSGRRRSVRLKGYDYSTPGNYFVTICTRNRDSCLATIVGGRSVLSSSGQIVERCWRRLRADFPALALDAFVVMPDHVHGVICILESKPDRKKYSLAAVVQNFKSVSSRAVGRGQGMLWQRSYYEHVIRTARELNLIRLYVEMNPRLWELGCDLRDAELSEEAIEKIISKYPPAQTW